MATAESTSRAWSDPDVVAGKRLWIEMRTPEEAIVSGPARSITVPGSKGSMGVLPRHAPLMSSLEPGYTKVTDESGNSTVFVTGSGFVEVFRNRVLVLVDFAEDPAEIDVARAVAARDRARARLRAPGEDIDVLRAELALQRAQVRLRFAPGHQ